MYNNIVKIKEFKDSIQISSFRLIDSTLSFNPGSNYSSDPDNILRISRSRSFSLLRDYIKANHFDYFVTMTLKDSIRYDISSAVKLFQDSINLYYKYSLRHCYKMVNLNLHEEIHRSESLEGLKMMRHFYRASYDSELRSFETSLRGSELSNEHSCDRLGRWLAF